MAARGEIKQTFKLKKLRKQGLTCKKLGNKSSKEMAICLTTYILMPTFGESDEPD